MRRLHNPWPKLRDFAESIDLHNADDVMHRHVPYGESASFASLWDHVLNMIC